MDEPADWPQRAERIRDSFARQTMMTTLGARIEALSPGRTVIALPFAAHFGQQHGYAHAGASFAIGDSAAGYAALGLLAPGREVVTVEMKINLLAPAVGLRLIAEGRVIRAGQRICVTTTEIFAETDAGGRRLIALMQGTMMPVDP